MKLICILALSSLIALGACRRETPHVTILLLDTSLSITPHGMDEEFREANASADSMHRGDTLIIIPITGDALTETPGHVLHLTAPLHRESYDHDLVVFRFEAHRQIKAMHDAVIAKPTYNTDIFGALDLADQEVDFEQRENKGVLVDMIVMSDFLEDDETWRFISDPALASPTAARALAECLAKNSVPRKAPRSVSLFLAESKDFVQVGRERQQAVVAFWKIYLSLRLRELVRLRMD